MTGQAEFNEVYFTDARIPDTHRLGEVGNGWRVAMTTLMNERSALGGSGSRRGAGTIAEAVSLWASRPERQTPVLRDRLTQLWLRSEAQRLTSERSRAAATVGGPGPEGSIGKLVGAELNQHIYQWCMDFLGPEGILYHGYEQGAATGERDWQGPDPAAVPAQPRQHHRRRHIRGDAQHPRRADPRTARRSACRCRHAVEGDSPWLSSAFTDEQNQLRAAVRKFCAENFDEADGAAADGVRSAVRPEGVGAARRRARRARAFGARSRRRRRRHTGRPGRRGRGTRRALACGPLFGTVFLAIPALVAAPAGAARDELLAELVEGRRTAAFAVADRAGVFDPDGGHGHRATATRLPAPSSAVVDAGAADDLLVAARGCRRSRPVRRRRRGAGRASARRWPRST